MESQEVIRAYMLEPGDVFKRREIYFKVLRLENDKIFYQAFYSEHGVVNGYTLDMGANSQERVILITNKIKQNEHQN